LNAVIISVGINLPQVLFLIILSEEIPETKRTNYKNQIIPGTSNKNNNQIHEKRNMKNSNYSDL